jgi:acyl-CoA synthetase (AMP-forming)/AMP-acid ligase II
MTMSPITAVYCDATFRPDGIAFIQGDDIWTYQRFTNEINRLARGLLARGLCKGDRVALHMRNVPELAIAYFACFRIGVIAAPLDTRLQTAELKPILSRLRPLLYIGQADLYSEVAEIDGSILSPLARYIVGRPPRGTLTRPWTDLLADSSDEAGLPEPSLDAPAVLLGTSGTTGESKFVIHTLATISAAAELFGRSSFDSDDIVVIATPMAHAIGFFSFLMSIWHGAEILLLERFIADEAVDAIERHQATWFSGLPLMMAEALESQKNRVRDVSSLKVCIVSGDMCPPRVQQDFENHFGIPLLSFWETTEVIGSLTLGSRPGPVSRAVEGAEVRLCDENGDLVSPGEFGELQVRGPNVTVGYWESPGVIGDATKDGWYHSGDLMREDENGELWFVSRKQDIIIRGGSNISPAEVERALASHPAVKDVGVAGIPDDLFGQRIVGFVELSKAANSVRLDDILANARRLIADYKLPEQLEIVPRVPRNSLGKIDRNALLASLSRRARRVAA